MADWMHGLIVGGGFALAMLTFSIVLTMFQIVVIEPMMIRLKWWWRLRNAYIVVVSMDRNDLSLIDDYSGKIHYHSFTSDVSYWCHHNMTGRHGCAPRVNQDDWVKSFYFARSEDAFLFKMRWI